MGLIEVPVDDLRLGIGNLAAHPAAQPPARLLSGLAVALLQERSHPFQSRGIGHLVQSVFGMIAFDFAAPVWKRLL